MKAVTTILFTLLYTLFSCFAVTSSAASTCSNIGCKNAVFSYKERGEITTDNSQDNCTHKPAVSAHVIQKQTNSISGSGNKCLLSIKPLFQKCLLSNLEVLNNKGQYPNAIAPLSCPLFIKNCVLLI
jgi:hypothetical protein